jgi:hypothetical protein
VFAVQLDLDEPISIKHVNSDLHEGFLSARLFLDADAYRGSRLAALPSLFDGAA